MKLKKMKNNLIVMICAVLLFCCLNSVQADCGCGKEELSPGVGGIDVSEPDAPQVTPYVPESGSSIPPSVLKAAQSVESNKGFSASIPLPDVIHPEKVTWVDISQTDANRLVCSGGKIVPEDVVYSKEKGVVIQVSKNGYEAYLKLQAVQNIDTKEVEYPKNPVEIYVSCGGETYGFIGRPKRIPSKTIYLVSRTKKIDKGRKTSLTTTEVDKAVIEIWKNVFLNSIPPAWEQVRPKKVNIDLGFSVIQPLRAWTIPGVGVLVRELVVTAKTKAIVKETDLLRADLVVNPIGISVDKHNLAKGEKTRAVIIEKVLSNEF